MGDFISREAAIKEVVVNSVKHRADPDVATDMIRAIEKLPAADVRPVVLCKECKHRPSKEYGRIIAPKDDGYTDYKCPFVCEDPWYNRMPADDDYCSCGEKREES